MKLMEALSFVEVGAGTIKDSLNSVGTTEEWSSTSTKLEVKMLFMDSSQLNFFAVLKERQI